VESFHNIQFKDGTLEIPRLVILDTTRSLFLNLVTFEQCNFNCSNDIATYLLLTDDLIDSTKDVRHLHDCGIIRHRLGSDAEVADSFDQICREVVLVGSHGYLSDLSNDVDTYSGNKWKCWIAILELKYFGNPWSIISLIVAFILLLLTLT